jgi:hypothetical protein
MAVRVHKALTPEEKLKLGNIMALCNELLSAEESAAEPETPPVEESVKKEEPPKEEASPPPAAAAEEEVKKSEAANEDAEDRMEELPEDDEAALAVLKILKTLSASESVKKSKPATQTPSPEAQALGQALLVMKSMQKRLDEQGQTLNGILEGMGITSEVLKVEKAAPRQAVQPSANDILAALASVVQKSASAEPAKPETMRDALEILWRQ